MDFCAAYTTSLTCTDFSQVLRPDLLHTRTAKYSPGLVRAALWFNFGLNDPGGKIRINDQKRWEAFWQYPARIYEMRSFPEMHLHIPSMSLPPWRTARSRVRSAPTYSNYTKVQ